MAKRVVAGGDLLCVDELELAARERESILTNHPGIHKQIWDFALFHQRTNHIVDIHNIYEINLISN